MNTYRAGGLMAAIAVLALVIIPTIADARAGRGGAIGSRGAKTFTAPPATQTAPRAAQPIQRTQTPRQAMQMRQAAPAPGMTRAGAFGGMRSGSFMAGLLGAGLLGLLFGYGLSGGLGGLAAILGLLAQIALVALAAFLLFSFFARRRQQPAQQPAMAAARAGTPPPPSYPMQNPATFARASESGAGAPAPAGAPIETGPLQLEEEDFNSFERLLNAVQTAYANEDMHALQRMATDEMCGYFLEDIEENRKLGQVMRIGDIKLLQGDLSEAWSEADAEYATVAMRFSLADAMVDRNSGEIIEGSLTESQEITEVWTFVRPSAGGPQDWKLSAVQPEELEDEDD